MELEQYNISVTRGFIPATDPLLSLPEAFRPWEEMGSNLPELIQSKLVRLSVKRLPIFPVTELEHEAEWWRAYSLLCFISHGYI